jgi:ribosomal protein L11 methyltransferase
VSWFALRVEPGARRDAIAAALFRSGAQGLHEDGALFVTHFPSEDEARSAADAVSAVGGEASWRIEPVDDTDWSRRWRESLGTYPVGELTIAPPWLSEGRDPLRTIVIDPGMGFGTGDHASTRGATRLLQRVVRRGSAVADLGAGSGVLSIAAAKLGASRVYAVEMDADALGNAEENIIRNGVEGIVHVLEGDATVLLPLLAPVDVIVANILAPVIVGLLPGMAAALRAHGHAVVAGILESESGPVRQSAESDGWRVVAEDREADWWSGLLARA